MKLNKYQESAMRTAVDKSAIDDLRHAAMGLVTEVGEFMDCLKKHDFYGTELDFPNLYEELGDILWYVALAARGLNIDLNNVAKTNIEKLRKRYPEKFTEQDAVERKDKQDDGWIPWNGGLFGPSGVEPGTLVTVCLKNGNQLIGSVSSFTWTDRIVSYKL